ncbi:hypothetical protein FSP39_021498 [Pinctada imbricata]|uniref:VWA7 N-terminal domain-containing protein n=1 Tax=Pinctada imbricata TaxID=66713 RepID=A0AA89BMX2_PINIB|nr:hypothetical protein FSP39_021498 [Pinctada imbricata]
MDAHFQYRIFIFTVTLTGSLAFPPQKILSEERTRSHHDITQEGIYKAVANILNEKYFAGSQNGNPVRVVSNFFASDSNGLQQFESAIDEIVQSSNTIQQDNGHIAFYTVNAEQIERAHIQMQTKYSEIRRLSRNGNNVDISFVRQKIGEFLFTLQEFYSNTNWVEIEEWKQSADIQIYSELGLYGFSTIS